MYTIYVFNSNAERLFDYKSNVAPMVDDVYAGPGIDKPNYKVIKRLLSTATGSENVISVSQTYPAI